MEYFGNHYMNLKSDVIKAERRILKELGFCVHVQHPHKMIISILNVLNRSQCQMLVQKSWNFMNDCLRSSVFVRYSPVHIGCACIVLASRILQIELPRNPHWWLLFDLKEDELVQIAAHIINLYQKETPTIDEIESYVRNLRQQKNLNVTGLTVNEEIPKCDTLSLSASAPQHSPRPTDNKAEPTVNPRSNSRHNFHHHHSHNPRHQSRENDDQCKKPYPRERPHSRTRDDQKRRK